MLNDSKDINLGYAVIEIYKSKFDTVFKNKCIKFVELLSDSGLLDLCLASDDSIVTAVKGYNIVMFPSKSKIKPAMTIDEERSICRIFGLEYATAKQLKSMITELLVRLAHS